jgi:DNA invertase Pin-like site-specific DNA recombinase
MKSSTSSRLVGYARVSSNGQELKLQLDALAKAGCARANIFTDTVSGATSARRGLDRRLEQLKQGDVLVVWRLDRLGRSMRHLLDLVEELRQRGVGFKPLCDGVIDTTMAFPALAQFEQRLIQERTNAGLAAARARGRRRGRKPIPVDDPRVHMVKF